MLPTTPWGLAHPLPCPMSPSGHGQALRALGGGVGLPSARSQPLQGLDP